MTPSLKAFLNSIYYALVFVVIPVGSVLVAVSVLDRTVRADD